MVLVTYEKKVLEVECDEVTLPGKLGYFGVLPGHVPLIAMLKVGELMYRIGKREQYLPADLTLLDVDAEVTVDRR
ncbi:MAG TPA: F0F1 ATP synthase subunit epsilon, partial [Thermoanaerobaculia bacterium]|nr:F0F1 ATP synthase subunit epsilon [Thermoanaerobaculia bacterium]